MSWLERQIETYGEGFGEDVQRYMQAAGLDKAFHDLSGSYGVRRFIVRCARQGKVIRIQEIESVPLQFGGGGPDNQSREAVGDLERSLTRLHNNMLGGPEWSIGAIGFVRDCDNQQIIYPFFDEDAQKISLNELPVPEQGHPLEGIQYKRLRDSMEAQIVPIAQKTQGTTHGWSVWQIQENELVLVYGAPEAPDSVVRKRCQVLGTFGSHQYWEWQVQSPLFEEEVFCWENLLCDWDAAVELGFVCTARLNADWLFFSVVNDADLTLFVAVWE